jgi:hypothetical protein
MTDLGCGRLYLLPACAVALAFVMLGASPARGQGSGGNAAATEDARWAPWLGCWAPERVPADQAVQVCVLPASAAGSGPERDVAVSMITFSGSQKILEETIVADGRDHQVDEPGCTGRRRSTWAAGAARLFTSTALVCEGRPAQQTSGLSAIVEADEWLDVQAITINGRESLRIRRYVRRRAAPPAPVADLVRSLPEPPVIQRAGLTVDDVIEASRAVSAATVEAWLSDSTSSVPIDRRTLVAMDDAGVPDGVTDLLVAKAYPERFEIRRRASTGGGGGGGAGAFWGSSFDVFGPWDVFYDPLAIGFAPMWLGYYGGYYGAYDPYYLTSGGLIAVTPGGAGALDAAHGRVVSGRGYTRVEPRDTAVDRGGSGGDSGAPIFVSGASGSGGGSGGVSSGGFSSGGGGSGGQTAVPR